MESLNFNAGRLGLSKEQLVSASYERMKTYVEFMGFRLGELSGQSVDIFDRSGRVVQKMSIQEIINNEPLRPYADRNL